MSRTKLTNEIVDETLIGRNIKRLDDYSFARVPIRFQCLTQTCNFIWKATPHAVMHRTGCPMCGGTKKLSNEIVDKRLANRSIKRIGNYVNTATKIDWLCLEDSCSKIWSAVPNDILGGRGCPFCGGHRKLTNEDVDKRLMGRDIQRLENYINDMTKIKFQCTKKNCQYIWSVIPMAIFRGDGCSACYGNVKLSNETVDQRLMGRNIQRMGNYVNNHTSLEFKCLENECGHTWHATTHAVIGSEETGCPACPLGKNERMIGKIFSDNFITYERGKQARDLFIDANIKRYRLDFYLPQFNTVIEYNGSQHYEPVRFGGQSIEEASILFEKQINRDHLIEELCVKNNIKLIWIDGRTYCGKRLIQYMTNTIIPSLKDSNG